MTVAANDKDGNTESKNQRKGNEFGYKEKCRGFAGNISATK